MFMETGKGMESTRLAGALLGQTYDHVFLIDVPENKLRIYDFSEMKEDKASFSEAADADACLTSLFENYHVMDKRIAPALMLRVPVMAQRLENESLAGLTFPVLEDGILRHKRATYCYADDKRSVICLTVQDVTDILEEEYSKIFAQLSGSILSGDDMPEIEPAYRKYFSEPADFEGHRALVAGTDEERVSFIAGALREFKIIVDEFNDGKEAMRCLSQSGTGTYDIVFLDTKMPSMDGVEVTRQLRKSRRLDLLDMTIVLLSDTDQRDKRIGALEAGADYHIFYPIEKSVIVEILLGELDNPTPKKAFELKGFKVIK